VKACHVNPIFYKQNPEFKTKILAKDQGEITLRNTDRFSLLPSEFEYQIKVVDEDRSSPEQNVLLKETTDPSSSSQNRSEDPERTPSPEFFTARQGEISSNAVSSSRVSLKRASDDETLSDEQTKRPKTSETDATVTIPNQSHNDPSTSAVVIKPDPDAQEVPQAPSSTSNNVISTLIKPDPDAPDTLAPTSSSTSTVTPVVKADPEVVKADPEPVAPSTNRAIRESCQFGIRCYNRTQNHRQAMAHPSDVDYRRPDFGSPPPNTPDCPFGASCYRRNPGHFQRLRHPPSGKILILLGRLIN
jgi:aprataxin and PNK-like factor